MRFDLDRGVSGHTAILFEHRWMTRDPPLHLASSHVLDAGGAGGNAMFLFVPSSSP